MYTLIGTLTALLAAGAHASPVISPADLLKQIQGGLGFDPNYVQPQAPPGTPAPRGIKIDPSSFLKNLTSLPEHKGTIPSIPSGHQESKRINQPDRRYQFMDPNQWPYRTVGRVNWNGASTYCTGALVGPRHFATARHCVPPNGGGFTFCPAYDNGPNPTFGCANAGVYYYWPYDVQGDCEIQEDWVIVTIDKRYGDGLGYFTPSVPDPSTFGKYVMNYMGYAGDLGGSRCWRQDNARIPGGSANFQQLQCSSTGPIFSEHNSAPGDSGAPMWYPGGVLWGVLHGGGNNPGGNFETAWASGQNLVNTIDQARKAYP